MSIKSELRAKIGAVTLNKGALPQLLGKRFLELYDNIERNIYSNLGNFGHTIVEHAKDYLRLVAPSGAKYAYVDAKTRKVLHEWTASAPGELPAVLSGTLIDSIESKIEWAESTDSLASVSLGVYSTRLGGMYPTVSFKGPDPKKKENYGKLFVKYGTGKQTPVKLYAKFLEEGTDKMAPRPFLNEAFDYAINVSKREFTGMLRDSLRYKMKSKKIPVHFRIYKGKGK